MREKRDYRDNLARLYERFPGREALSIKETAALLGLDPRTVREVADLPRKRVGNLYIVPIVGLAKWLS